LVQGGVYSLPYGGVGSCLFVCLFVCVCVRERECVCVCNLNIHLLCGGRGTSSCLLSSFLLLSTRYVRYLMAISWMAFIAFLISVMWGYVGIQGVICFLCKWLPLLLL
jgi:hypothetical protein